MTGGFDGFPDDLRQTAGKIGSVIGGVADLVWQGPSGDYGHAGVHRGWAIFIEDMKTAVQALHDKVNEHGESLKTAASVYEGSDAEVGAKLGGLGEAVHSVGGMVGGGFAGPILGRGADIGGMGFVNPEVARRLFPEGSIGSRLNPESDGDEGILY